MQKMSEKEAKDIIYMWAMERASDGDVEACEAFDMAIKALEEIQQYRSIGTVEEIEKGIKQSEEEFDMLMEYRNIGTVDQCREAVERMKPKRPNVKNNFMEGYMVCPKCGRGIGLGKWREELSDLFKHCQDCGQALDWSE